MSNPSDEDFSVHVLDLLRSNGSEGLYPGLAEFAGEGDLLSAPYQPQAFIITPLVDGALKYERRVQQIRDEATRLLPGNPPVRIEGYVPFGPDPRWEVPNGKVLLQYHPRALFTKLGENRHAYAGARLWLENRCIATMSWWPLDTQVPESSATGGRGFSYP